jgi:hypothetical protein
MQHTSTLCVQNAELKCDKACGTYRATGFGGANVVDALVFEIAYSDGYLNCK